MPDPAKIEALQAAGYKILPVCLTCKHLNPAGPRSRAWGTCQLVSYEHGKHTGEPRKATVHVAGSCDKHEMRDGHHIGLSDTGFLRFTQTEANRLAARLEQAREALSEWDACLSHGAGPPRLPTPETINRAADAVAALRAALEPGASCERL